MFENPRRGRQARNFTTNVPKILVFKSSSEQIFSRKLPLGAPVLLVKTHQCARNVTFIFHSKFVCFGGTFILALYVQLALINALVHGIACKQCSCNLQF